MAGSQPIAVPLLKRGSSMNAIKMLSFLTNGGLFLERR